MSFFLAIYLFLVIVRPHEYMRELLGFPLPGIILGITFLFWLAREKKNLDPQHMALLGWLFLSALMSMVVMTYVEGAWRVIAQFSTLAMFFVALHSASHDRDVLRRLLGVIVLSASVLALHSVDQAQNGVGWTGQTLTSERVRYIGVFADPNDLGMLFVFCVPLAGYFLGRASLLVKPFWLALMGLFVYSIYLTDSRGTMLTLLLLMAVYFWRKFGTVVTSTVGVLALPIVFVATRLATIDTEESSTAGRLDAWFAGLQMFESSPLFGIGSGLFQEHHIRTAHNSWVLVIAELGIVGYAPWFIMTALALLLVGSIAFKRALPGVSGELPPGDVPVDERRLALSLFWAILAIQSAAFFLSRSFEFLFFLMWAVSIGYFIGACRRLGWKLDYDIRNHWKVWGIGVLGSVLALYILVRVGLVVL